MAGKSSEWKSTTSSYQCREGPDYQHCQVTYTDYMKVVF